MKKRILRAFSALLITFALCTAMNAAAFLIDTPDMRQHAWQGALMLCQEESTPQMVGGFRTAQLDNFTSVLILKTAAYTGEETLLQKTLGGYRVDMPAGEGESEWEAFCNYEDGANSPTGGLSYSRYWHGYTLPLRLLLCVFNLANIQMLMYFAQLALFVLVLFLLKKRALSCLIPGFFLSYFLLMPAASGVCLQYFPLTLIMLLSCAALLKWDAAIDRAVTLPGFFALAGMLANYFDLLTFPLITLLFPLSILLALRLKEGESGARLFVRAVLLSVCWAAGYGGMWMAKWLLNALVFGSGMLYGVFAQALLRVSDHADGETISRIAVLKENFANILSKSSYLLLILMSGFAVLLPAAKRTVQTRRIRVDARALVLAAPALIAVMWYIVLANHSANHDYYTYRSAAGAIFALFAALACFLDPQQTQA